VVVEVAGTRVVEDEVADEHMEAADEVEKLSIKYKRTVRTQPRAWARRHDHNQFYSTTSTADFESH